MKALKDKILISKVCIETTIFLLLVYFWEIMLIAKHFKQMPIMGKVNLTLFINRYVSRFIN